MESQAEGEEAQEKERRKDRDRQAGWWYQLMQSSQIYIDPSSQGSKFVRADKRKKSAERRQGQAPPAREGVVEGAESSQEGGGSGAGSGGDSAGSRGRPSWMGSPPESVLNQDKESDPPEAAARDSSPAQGQNLRWGRLFGSSVGSPVWTEAVEQKTKTQKSRAPSGWLGLDRSVLDLMAHAIGANGGRREELPASSPQAPTETTHPVQQSPCEVQALCHHIATEPGQLSFNKGDILRVLSKADPDWLLCSLGSTRGLVPIIYVTLNGMEDSQDARE